MSTAVDVNQVEDQLISMHDQLVEKATEAGETLKLFIAQRREVRDSEEAMQQQLAQLMGGSVAPAPAPSSSPSGRRGRPAKKTAAAKKTASSKAPAKKKSAKKSSDKGGYANDKSLAQVIMEVLDRKGNENGLTIAAIRDCIDSEKLWLTEKDLSKQIQTNLGSLKSRGKIVRDNEEKVYYIPEAD